MAPLTQSPFLQALGYAIINSLWQFALLWLIYVAIYSFLKLSSHQKYAAGVVIQLAGFSWFAGTFIFYLRRFLQLEEIYIQQKSFSFNFAGGGPATLREHFFAGLLKAETLLPYLSVAYLLILLFLALKLVRTYRLTKSIKTKGLQKIEIKWRLFVKQFSHQLGIKREVKIYLSEMVKTPLTIGFFKPFILIPLASLNHLTADQMEAVILHELAHIKRFDYLFNLFLALIDIALFFNPFMHLINSNLKRERENCCDDWVLQYEYNPASYANALLQIATCQPSNLLALQAADNKKVLLNRIIRMIEKKEKTFFNYRYQIIASLVMFTVLSSLAVLSSRHNAKNTAAKPSGQQVNAEPTIEIAKTPIFNPDFFIGTDGEKAVNNNRFLNQKIETRSFFLDPPTVKKIIAVQNNLTCNQKHDSRTHMKNVPEPETPKYAEIPSAPDEPVAEDLVKDTEPFNGASDEMQLDVQALKEDQLAQAEDQLKGLFAHLFQENKTLINQKQVMAAIKVALDQLKTMKLRSISTYSKECNDAGINALALNNLRNEPLFAPCDLEKLQSITKELKVHTERAQQQRNRAERAFRLYYNGIQYPQPEVITHVPLPEKPHTFSFEFSTDPKVTFDTPNSFSHKKWKTTNKTFRVNTDVNTDFQDVPPSPSSKSKAAVKIQSGKRNVVIIRI